ncbi:MAG: amidohydrolase [Gemmatimonadales bacterium]
MTRQTRREFIEIGTAMGTAIGIGGWPSSHTGTPNSRAVSGPGPDMVVLNAKIYTIDDTQPRAQAFAVKQGRFLAVGTSADMRNLATSDTTVLDASGMTIVPGFIDAHTHPAYAGIFELTQVNVDLRSIAEIKAALKERARHTPSGQWVIGFKYDDTKVRDGRKLTRKDLDDAVPDHPVQVTHRGGHTSWYNSKAFELAGITADTPDPPHGKYYHDGNELNGLVAEQANAPFEQIIPSGSTREQRQAGVALISKLMTAAGLTSVHDALTTREYATAYEDAYKAGELGFRVYMMLRGAAYEDVKASGLYTGLGDEHLRIGGVKFTADGSASERTMRMSTPYVGRPNDFGILNMTQQEIHEAVEEAHRKRFQIGIHANGDVAIDMVLSAYERVQKLWPRSDPRHRIEHCSLVNPDLLKRIKAVGAIPTPFYTYIHYHGNKWVEYGAEKMRWMFAHRSFIDFQIPVAGGSDYIPGPFEPLMAIQSMVTRKDMSGRVWGPNQKITVDEALRVCTINGAHASFEENFKGSITVGKLADFVVLAEDPHDVDPDRIKEIPVVRTVVGGTTMHEQVG